jgi:hypothetical protein
MFVMLSTLSLNPRPWSILPSLAHAGAFVNDQDVGLRWVYLLEQIH